MKQTILFLLLVTCIHLNAQTTYEIKKDIGYYPENISQNDAYLKSQCTIDVYYPKNKKNFATVIWFHGGGLTGGNKEIPKQLMENGFAIIGVGYRLSPKVKAIACIEDAAAVTSWVFNHIAEYGGDQNAIFLSGHSAGAYLSLMITMDKKYLSKYNIDANKIAGVISLSSQTITHFTIREERGIKGTQPIIDEYAPLYHVRKDVPPIILITGDAEKEMLGRYEENAYLYRMLLLNKASAVKLYKMDGYDHGNMPLASYPLMINEIARLQKEMKK
ncbi:MULTISPECIES: alpha/beta hydrolase [Niastella]|uniref:Alpha/beta hydrolase n=1 Tax=Niastella soli TaxID=2821487 RepID=A0ABS3YLE2_9BACT|nr:alpha/beta hydrolase [Niastella soli]MBO9198669.1 alpha/beta hydrolase [Niastella soli]